MTGAEYYAENAGRIKARNATHRAANPAKVKAIRAKSYAKNRDKINARAAQWRQTNSDKIKVWGAQRRRDQPEKEKERVARWRAANSERIKTRRAERNRHNRAKVNAAQAAWVRNNPATQRAIQARYRRSNLAKGLVQTAARRARKLAAPGRGIGASDLAEILRESMGLCAYCNGRRRLTLDHIVSLARGGAHDVSNAAAACLSCNCSKSDTALVVWLSQRAALRMAA